MAGPIEDTQARELSSTIAQVSEAKNLNFTNSEPEEGGEVTNSSAWGTVEPELPFSIFSQREKVFIVIMASLAALFSPLTANIYYPALNVLASDLHVSNTLINLTITSYLIFQGIAPTFIGAISDDAGRRPAYLICFVIFLGANIGLALQSNYAALFVLRCLQSSGSSGTVALANAVVADIVTSSQRGTYMAYASLGALLGPALGPVIGGLLAEFLGWRAIFWFLAIFGGIALVVFAIFLPETCRKVVGNGSIPVAKWNNSLITHLRLRKLRREGKFVEQDSSKTYKPRLNLLTSLRIIVDKESGIILFYAGLLFTVFYMVLTGLPSLLTAKYGFNALQVGLCYIPAGFGAMLAAMSGGRFSDWNFKRHAARLGVEISKQKQQNLRELPIEAIRLETTIPFLVLGAISLLIYGWVMEKCHSLAGDLILLLLGTLSASGAFQGLSTLVVDLNRDTPGSATAAMNLVRCLMGAGGVAAVIPLMDKIGVGWTATLVVGIWVLMSPIVWFIMERGPDWREQKRLRLEELRIKREGETGADVDVEKQAARGPVEPAVEKET